VAEVSKAKMRKVQGLLCSALMVSAQEQRNDLRSQPRIRPRDIVQKRAALLLHPRA